MTARRDRVTLVVVHSGAVTDEQFDELLKHLDGNVRYSEKTGRMHLMWWLREGIGPTFEALYAHGANAYRNTFHVPPHSISVTVEMTDQDGLLHWQRGREVTS